MKKSNKEYDLTKSLLSIVRTPVGVIKESDEKKTEEKEEAIAITNDARFGQDVLKNQIDAFKKSVNPGAKFSHENKEDAESNPLVYYPESGNLVFSGSIPTLSDLKFQFSLNDVTNAPYIFVDGLALTDDVLNTLHKMAGYYKNWRESWLSSTDLLDKLKKDRDA